MKSIYPFPKWFPDSALDDVQRLARRLTGHAFCLVLGGGGSRGFAHAGVIRALEESGLEADMIGGTSTGALVGGLYAYGRSWSEMVADGEKFGQPKELFDYTLPMVSFFASKKLTRMLIQQFGKVFIEDLWRPFFCMSTNLTQAKPVVHREGLLWRAVRASLAIPGVFSPILERGQVLVDGGTMNNVPVDVMSRMCEGGVVVAVDVSPKKDLGIGLSFGTSISGWQVLWHRLNPFTQPLEVPSLFTTIMRANEINEVYSRSSKRDLAHLTIYPPAEQFSILDFRPARAIAEVGYQAGRVAIAEWLDKAETRKLLGRDLQQTPCEPGRRVIE